MKKLGLLLGLFCLVFLAACGGGGGSDSWNPDYTISGSSSDSALPAGGPYSVEVSSTSARITGGTDALISELLVIGSSNRLELYGFAAEILLDGTSNRLYLYGDAETVECAGSSNQVHLPAGSAAAVITTGTVCSVSFDLPALP